MITGIFIIALSVALIHATYNWQKEKNKRCEQRSVKSIYKVISHIDTTYIPMDGVAFSTYEVQDLVTGDYSSYEISGEPMEPEITLGGILVIYDDNNWTYTFKKKNVCEYAEPEITYPEGHPFYCETEPINKALQCTTEKEKVFVIYPLGDSDKENHILSDKYKKIYEERYDVLGLIGTPKTETPYWISLQEYVDLTVEYFNDNLIKE